MLPPFEERAVAFLDVLGFKSLVTQAETTASKLESLTKLRDTVVAHVHHDNFKLDSTVPSEVRPKYLFVSDSIILSAPISFGGYSGLDIVVLKTIQVAQKLFEIGHLIRGGIAVGSVWHDDKNIFGTGYVEAYQTEQKAVHPRVTLANSARDLWTGSSPFMPDLCLAGSDGHFEVSLLHQTLLLQSGRNLEPFYEQFRALLLTTLSAAALGSPERSKWEWMVSHFNAAVGRHGINVQAISDLPFPTQS